MHQPMVAAPVLVRYAAAIHAPDMCPLPIAPTPGNPSQPHDRNGCCPGPRRCRRPEDRRPSRRPACLTILVLTIPILTTKRPRGEAASPAPEEPTGAATPSLHRCADCPASPPSPAIHDASLRTQAGPCPTGRTSVSRPLWPFVFSVLNHPPVQRHRPHHGAKTALPAAISEGFSTQRTRRGTEGHGGFRANPRASRPGADATRQDITQRHRPGTQDGTSPRGGARPRRINGGVQGQDGGIRSEGPQRRLPKPVSHSETIFRRTNHRHGLAQTAAEENGTGRATIPNHETMSPPPNFETAM